MPTNIAEGCGRFGEREPGRFLEIAGGSASEVEYLLMLSTDLGYLAADRRKPLHEAATEVKKMLTAFHNKLQRADSPL